MAVLKLHENRMLLQCHFNDKEKAKSIIGWSMEKKGKQFLGWSYPLSPETLAMIKQFFPAVQVSPEVQTKLEHYEIFQQEILAIKNAPNIELPYEMPIKATPFDHQRKAFLLGTKLERMFLFLEQGLGKTLTSMAIIGHRHLYNGLKRLLIICPVAVMPGWKVEFEDEDNGAKFPYQIKVLDGNKDKKLQALDSFEHPDTAPYLQVVVINYESSWRIQDELAHWLKQAGNGEHAMIVADECQKLKTPNSSQSKGIHKIANDANVKYRIGLTGTPIGKNEVDWFGQYRFVEPEIFGTGFTAYKNRYFLWGGFENRSVIGYQFYDELIKKAHSIAFRLTKDEALDLPERTMQARYIDLSPSSKKVYKKMRDDSIAELESGDKITAQNVLTRLLRLSQVTGGFVKDEEEVVHKIGDEKLKVLEEELEELMDIDNKKVVVFVRFVAEIQAIEEMIQKHGWGYAKISGAVPKEKRGDEIQRFRTDPNCRIFIAQLQTAGAGLNLQVADTGIYYSLDFSLLNFEQSKDRIHRIGQKNKVSYICLLAKGTVDEKIYNDLKKKKDVADNAIDNWQDYFITP